MNDEGLVPQGNPLRPRSLAAAGLGSLATLAALAASPRPAWAAPAVLLGVATASYGVLDTLGTFDDEPRAARRLEPRALLAALLAVAGSLFLAWLALVLAARGVLPAPRLSAGVLVSASALGVLLAGFRLLRAFGAVHGPMRSSRGLWLAGAGALLALPLLGSHSLIDPWETHYAEVAREMLARSDWISFWWAQEEFFQSKPPLTFWLEGLSFLALGVRFAPDGVLDGSAATPAPEWAVRLPGVLCAAVAVWLLYRAVARASGRRAALFAGLVLLTTPYWFLIARQGMTDMPYAAALTAALSLFALGLGTPPDAPLGGVELALGRRRFRLSAAHAVLGLVLVTSLPQILYLVSRNLTLFLDGPDAGVLVHGDELLFGSPGNCGLPGNDPCAPAYPAHPALQPGVTALLVGVVLGLFLFANRGERRAQRWYFLAAWYFVALSTLAKGAPGLVLPIAILLALVFVERRFADLPRLELVSAALLLGCITLPWYLQAFLRHGSVFTDRLLLHDMYKRAFEHVHDTNAGDDVSIGYYLWQLGYGLFPWSGLAVAAFFLGFSARASEGTRRRQLRTLLGLWFLVAFAVFSFSLTKYHHYVLPAVPPLAVLIGLWLDAAYRARARSGSALDFGRSTALGLGALLGGAAVLLVGRDLVQNGQVEGQARLLHLFTYNYSRLWPSTLDFRAALSALAVLGAVCTALLALPRLRRGAVWGVLGAAAIFALYVSNVYLVRVAPHWGQRETILAYYQARKGPEELLVAFQMNWKGENFYTGNHVAAFVTSGEEFRRWLERQRARGTRVVYFMTEFSRETVLKTELGGFRAYRRLTERALNNKFFLARVEL